MSKGKSKMSEAWERVAYEIGNIIQEAAAFHPQLAPLHGSFLNFARKYRVKKPNHPATLIPQLVSTINRQAEEVAALKNLLRPKQ